MTHPDDEILHACVHGEADGPTTLGVEEHIRFCDACAGTLAEMRAIHERLSRAFDGDPKVASALARSVARRLGSRLRWKARLLRTAASLLIGGLLGYGLTPRCERGPEHPAPVTSAPPIIAPTVSILAVLGDVVSSHAAGPRDIPLRAGSVFEGSIDQIRSRGGGCSLRSDSVILRLGPRSTLTFSPRDAPELIHGRALVSGLHGRVVASGHDLTWDADAELEILIEDVPSKLQPEPMRTTSVWVHRGEAWIGATRLARQTLAIATDLGLETKTFTGGAVASAWVHPLLGIEPDVEELIARRVDDLLGDGDWNDRSTALALRALGPRVIPFLATYADRKAVDLDTRRGIARTIADLAELADARRLLRFLGDEDGPTRVEAARGLARLAGSDLGVAPESWESSAVAKKTDFVWRDWVRRVSGQYPLAR